MANQEFTDFEVEYDFTETKSWDGEQTLVPPGDYVLTVTAIEQKPPGASGAPYVAVTFEVADGELKGAKVFNNYSFSEKAAGRVKQLMVACGAQLDKFRASQIMGATIKGTVYHTEGDARADENGNVLPARTFANLKNEQPLDDSETAAEAEPEVQAPPVTKAAPAAKAATPPVANKAANGKPAGTARRA